MSNVVYVRNKDCPWTDLDKNFIIFFSLLQLESKSYRTKQCWPYIGNFFFGFFLDYFLYRYINLHIEPFNYAIKRFVFIFAQPMLAAQ
jgi:hypothetical protein